MTTHTPLRLPDTMQRADIGPYLADLRAYFGLNLQDVASHLHIRVRYLQGIETNAYEQLPGPVYARGYLFTYAEFLGLDAQQVVDICFGAEQKPLTAPPPMSATARQFDAMQWRNGAIIALVCAMAVLLFAQLHRHHGASKTETVPPVPEELLSINHTLVMPTPRNHDCLLGDDWLNCISDTQAWAMASDDALAIFDRQLEEAANMPENEDDLSPPEAVVHKPKTIRHVVEKTIPEPEPKKPEHARSEHAEKHIYRYHSADHLNDTSGDSDGGYVDHNAVDNY